MASRRRKRTQRRRHTVPSQDPVRIDQDVARRTHAILDAVIFDLLESTLDFAIRTRPRTSRAELIRSRHLLAIGQDLATVAAAYELVSRRSAAPARSPRNEGSG